MKIDPEILLYACVGGFVFWNLLKVLIEWWLLKREEKDWR